MLWPIVTLSAYAAFVSAAVWMVRVTLRTPDAAANPPQHLSRLDLAFVTITTLFILTARLPILRLSRDLQPDEAQFSANAIMVATTGWLNWDSSDSGSSGPLNCMIQAWPLLFGFDITFTTMHITGAILACALAGLIYLVLCVEFGRLYALIFSFPAVLFLGATTHWDLVHTSSLYLPLTLATFGVLATVSIWRRPNTLLAIAGAFALGMIVLTKLQAAPLGLGIGIALLIAHTKWAPALTARIIRAVPTILAAVLPLAMSLLPLVLSGRSEDFIVETLTYSAAYVSSPVNPLTWIKGIFSIPLLALMVALFGLVILTSGWLWLKGWRNTDIFTWFSLALVGIAGLAIVSPGKPHQLYLLFLVPTLPLLAAALTREALSRREPPPQFAPRGASLLVVGVALVMLPGAIIETSSSPAVRTDGVLASAGLRFRSPYILQHLMPRKDDKLIVYGYMPYFYVLAGMPSGTRETWGENVILEHERSDREYYRRRFIAEMDERRPTIIIDAVTFTDHVYRDPAQQGPRAFPALAERLARDYIQVSRGALEAGCPQIYLRRDRADQLAAGQAEITSVAATGTLRDEAGEYGPEHVIDRDVFESCVDRWLAPERTPARIELTLAHADRVSRVSLLNTRGRWRMPDIDSMSYEKNIVDNVAAYHAARTAVVQLMRGDRVILERQVEVDSYPYWTNVDFAESREATDHIVIHLPDWRGRGPGLNEVVVFRAGELTADSLTAAADNGTERREAR